MTAWVVCVWRGKVDNTNDKSLEENISQIYNIVNMYTIKERVDITCFSIVFILYIVKLIFNMALQVLSRWLQKKKSWNKSNEILKKKSYYNKCWGTSYR